MKLFDKLKNALFEEEYVEIEEERTPVKRKEKAPIAKKIDLSSTSSSNSSREVRNSSIEEKKELPKDDVVSDRELLKPDGSFKFPMTFEDEDFKPEPPVVTKPKSTPLYQRKEEKKVDLYQKKRDYQIPEYGAYEKKEEVKMFRPSPIISPIYGVLDRNYTKDEVSSKRDVRISGYKGKMDIDAVREKAYGDLTSEIGLAMDAEEKKKERYHEEYNAIEEDDNLLFNMRDDDTPAVSKVTVGDAEEYFQDLGLEYNIDYKDASKEKATGRRVYKNKDLDSDEEDNKKEALEDNLFDLIDSMYEDKG